MKKFLVKLILKKLLTSSGIVEKGERVWCLALYQIGATRFENDLADNQARAYSGDKCIYAAPLYTELAAHYLINNIPDISVVLPAFEQLKSLIDNSKKSI